MKPRMAEEALRILYQRKAFREETGMDEDHYPEGTPPPPPPRPTGRTGRHTDPKLAASPGVHSAAAIFPAPAPAPARPRASPPSALTGGKPRDNRALPCQTSAAQVASDPPEPAGTGRLVACRLAL